MDDLVVIGCDLMSSPVCTSPLCRPVKLNFSPFVTLDFVSWLYWGYWHPRADERHGNPPQGNQEPLMVRDKVGRPQVSSGQASPWNVILLPSVLWHCWLGDRKGIRPVKSWVLVCWWWWFYWNFARLIAPLVTATSIIFCFNKHWLT